MPYQIDGYHNATFSSPENELTAMRIAERDRTNHGSTHQERSFFIHHVQFTYITPILPHGVGKDLLFLYFYNL